MHTKPSSFRMVAALSLAPTMMVGKRPERWEETLSEMPQNEHWVEARLYALKFVASEFELADRSSIGFAAEPPVEEFWSSSDTLFARICEKVPAKLARWWAEVPCNFTTAPIAATKPDVQLGQEHYRRGRLSRQMTMLLTADADNVAPFADIGTPNEYRAFDIREFRDCRDMDDNLAILIVNIHT
jgi:hypothetical protein